MLQWKSTKYYKFWFCDCSLSYNHAKRMSRIILLSVACMGPLSFPLYLKRDKTFRKILKKKSVLWFSLQSLSKIFLILRTLERGMMINVYTSSLISIRYSCQIFMKRAFSRTNFRKILTYKISWKSVQWEPSCSMRTDGQTVGQMWRS